jgi:hypothetical protein
MPVVKKAGVGVARLVLFGALVVACSKEIGGGRERVEPHDLEEGDGGIDAGSCPEYEADAGVVRLMRGCPLTIEYGIR